MRTILFTTSFVFIAVFATAQHKIIAVSSSKGPVIEHKVTSGETLYGVSNVYKAKVSDVAALNKFELTRSLRIGESIKIPLSSLEETRFGTGAPVYYKVAGKDNLKAVSKRFNNMPVKNIMIWNELKEGEDIKKGQEIIVGYLPKGVGSPEQMEAKEAQMKQVEVAETAKATGNNPSSASGILEQASIVGTNINIRKGPGTDQPVVGTAQQGDIVEVIKKINNEWSSIRTAAGEGYIASQFLQSLTKKATITGTNINIRKGPSTDQPAIAAAQLNDVVEVLRNVDGEWAAIRTSNGTEGYMASRFFAVEGTVAPPKEAEVAEVSKIEEDQKAEAIIEEKIADKQKAEEVAKTQAAEIDETGFYKNAFEKNSNPALLANRTLMSGVFKTDAGWSDQKYYMLIDGVMPGTIVKVSNPQNGKMIYAKVLGSMKEVKYSENLNVRISEAAANAMQINDMDQFVVTVNY